MILSRYEFRMLARLLYACSVERPENKFSNDLFSARWRFTPFRLKIYSMQARAWSANVQIVKTIPDIHNVALRLGLRLITVSMFVSLPIIAGPLRPAPLRPVAGDDRQRNEHAHGDQSQSEPECHVVDVRDCLHNLNVSRPRPCLHRINFQPERSESPS